MQEISLIVDEGVDGEAFLGLSGQDLAGIGVKLGPRMKLMKLIQENVVQQKISIPDSLYRIPIGSGIVKEIPIVVREITVDDILSINTESGDTVETSAAVYNQLVC